MEVAAPVRKCDLVMFKRKAGMEYERGVLVNIMPGGNNAVEVMRLDGTVVSTTSDRLVVVDRSYFSPGHIVASVSDLSGQVGVITRASTAVDLVGCSELKVADGGVNKPTSVAATSTSVSSTELRRITDFTVGDYVVLGPWLGWVAELSLDVDVLFDDGAICRVTKAEGKLESVDKNNGTHRLRLTSTVFCPGQRVAGSESTLKAARWIKGYWKPSRDRCTVAKVDAAGVLVYWVASRELGTAKALIQASAPHAYQPRNKLTLFPCAAAPASLWWIGDRCFFRTPTAQQPSPSQPPAQKRMGVKRRISHSLRPASSLEQPPVLSVVGTLTTLDVLWQDGTRQCSVPSASLLSFEDTKNNHDFFPGQHVISRSASSSTARSGVVQSLNCKDQTACVSWFSAGEVACEYDETVSTYDLARNFDKDLFYGDVVIRIWDGNGGESTEAAAATNQHDLSWVGEIVDLCDDGHVQVRWGDGNMSKVLARWIAVVKHQNVSDILKEIGAWVDGDGIGDHNMNGMVDKEQGNPQATTQEAAIANTDNDDDGDEDDDMKDDNADESTAAVAGSNIGEGGDGSGSTREGKTTAGDEPFRFPRFEVVAKSPVDHHFLDSMAQQGTAAGRKWTKRVQKEWKSLENDLPDTIYVQAFEERMDLLRAAMVGASGTPYHDGLFFFDLHLPPSYPADPPLVNYRSFGLRLNPNLYPSGTVCLSLLNTFGGQGAELWSPEASSILQVVVSIQGLVLTAQPYYNEPAVGAQAGTPVGRRNELPYNENAYLLTLQTMLHLLRRPPAGLEGLVRDHFRRRGQRVLRACQAYLEEGCVVGTLDGEGHPTAAVASREERSCSAGFRLALQNILPRLGEAITAIGVTREAPH